MPNFFLRRRSNFRDSRGVSLFVVVGLTFVLLVVATTVAKFVLGFMQTTSQVERANIAYSAAESGIELALYDLVAYKDGFQTDPSSEICDSGVELAATDNFDSICDDSNPYRFVNFTDVALSGGRGFWRIFARTLESSGEYFIPNPYFVGDKNGELDVDEWGELTKNRSLSLSLLTDKIPDETDPQNRFTWLSDSGAKKIIFSPGENWDPDANGDDSDELFTWTFSGIDGAGGEHTLQGVAWESDFKNQDCDEDGNILGDEYCFIFDLNDFGSHNPAAPDGDVFAGEDINRNLENSDDSIGASFNRVSAVEETFRFARPKDFLTELGTAMTKVDSAKQWTSARLTINLIATLSETSGVPSNSLKYKLTSDEPWADEYTYIVSEGFAGDVKQAIETSFRRESVIPIFSYVIFQ